MLSYCEITERKLTIKRSTAIHVTPYFSLRTRSSSIYQITDETTHARVRSRNDLTLCGARSDARRGHVFVDARCVFGQRFPDDHGFTRATYKRKGTDGGAEGDKTHLLLKRDSQATLENEARASQPVRAPSLCPHAPARYRRPPLCSRSESRKRRNANRSYKPTSLPRESERKRRRGREREKLIRFRSRCVGCIGTSGLPRCAFCA